MNPKALTLLALVCSCADADEAGATEHALPSDDTACLPTLVASPAELHFEVLVGTSGEERVTLRYDGCGTGSIDVIALSDETQPYVVSALGSILLPPGGTTTFAVTFAPTEIGEFDTSVDVSLNDPHAPITSVLVFGIAAGG